MRDISFHYTNPEMVSDLIRIIPLIEGDKVLDAGSGKNKVWFNALPKFVSRLECELEDGKNFYEWREEVDWIIGNPPFHESWKFTEKASCYAQRGIAWLINNQALNSHMTPRRLSLLKDKGFFLQRIHVVQDKRWFGRYYFVIFEKVMNYSLTWEKKVYS